MIKWTASNDINQEAAGLIFVLLTPFLKKFLTLGPKDEVIGIEIHGGRITAHVEMKE